MLYNFCIINMDTLYSSKTSNNTLFHFMPNTNYFRNCKQILYNIYS